MRCFRLQSYEQIVPTRITNSVAAGIGKGCSWILIIIYRTLLFFRAYILFDSNVGIVGNRS